MAKEMTYRELVERFGYSVAYGLLLSLDQSSNLKMGNVGVGHLNEEVRLERALSFLNQEDLSMEAH